MFRMVGGQRVEMTAQEQAEWLSQQATGDSVPDFVTKLQLRSACLETPHAGSDWWTLAKAALAASSASVQEEWELASVIERTNTTFIAFATALGADSDDIDNVFRVAARK